MYMFPIALLFIIVFARISTCYDSRISKGKYVTIKNDLLAKLLIEKEHFLNNRNKYTLKKDRNKMSVMGLTFYLCAIFIVFLTLALLILPKIPCTPFEIDTTKMHLYANTLNQKIPIIATIILLCAEFIYFAVLIFKCKKEVEQKWIKILICISSTVIGLVSFVIIVEMLFELVKW